MKYAGGALLPTLRVDRESGRPIAVQLVSAIRELVLSGVLAPGQRLPSSRTFAHDQGISRTTAISVYESLTQGDIAFDNKLEGSRLGIGLGYERQAGSATFLNVQVNAERGLGSASGVRAVSGTLGIKHLF